MEFSFFYPEGAEIIPMTMMICKMNPQHGLIDRLIEKPECTKCEGGKGRVESVSGYLKEGERYSVVKALLPKRQLIVIRVRQKMGRFIHWLRYLPP